MKKNVRIFTLLAVCVLTLGVWTMLHGQNQNQGNGFSSGTFFLTINDATTGAFVSHTVITLHADHTASAIDSGQEDQFPVPFSSQLGAWSQSPSGVVNVKTLDFSFPFATQGSARVDYKFNAGLPGQVQGSIVLTIFAPDADPQGNGGTPGGTFNFTGERVTAP